MKTITVYQEGDDTPHPVKLIELLYQITEEICAAAQNEKTAHEAIAHIGIFEQDFNSGDACDELFVDDMKEYVRNAFKTIHSGKELKE